MEKATFAHLGGKPVLVSVCRIGRQLLIASVLASMLWGCGGGGGTSFPGPVASGPTSTPTSATATLGAAGGSLSTSDGRVVVTVPSQAVSTNTNFAIAILPSVAASAVVGDRTVQLSPAGVTFASPVELRLQYDPVWLATEWAPSAMTLAKWDGIDWGPVRTAIDETNKMLIAKIGGFSTWASVQAGGSNSSPDHSWQSSGGCLRTTTAVYNDKLDALGTMLFKTAPNSQTGCVTGPYLEAGYSRFITSMQHHAGVDFRAAEGTPIYAPFNGKVVAQVLNPGTSSPASTLTMESVISGQTYRLLFLHCSSHELVRGQQSLGIPAVNTPVLAGDRVCLAGKVGALTSHLHFEVKRAGQDMDNLRAMSGSRGVCANSSFANGWDSSMQTFTRPMTQPGCSLNDIRTNSVDPTVIVEPEPVLQTSLTDNFDGPTPNTTLWNVVTGSGGYQLAGGLLTLGLGSNFNTKGKMVLSGSKIVVDAIMGNVESTIALVDADAPDWTNFIAAGNTAYRGWGLDIQAGGTFALTGPVTGGTLISAEMSNVAANSIYDTGAKAYRLTVDNSTVTIQRGSAMSSLSEKLQVKMANSIAGRRFYLLISTGGGAPYGPGIFDGIAASSGSQLSQVIAFNDPASQTLGVAPAALSATASSGLVVAFTSRTPTVCTVNGSTLTLVAAGTCTINADQGGNVTYSAAATVTRSFTINQGTLLQQTIAFVAPPTQTLGVAPPTLSATASSGLPVGFTSSTQSVCTVSGSTLTLVSAGTCSISADQGGSSTYAAAPSVVQSFTVNSATLLSQTISFVAPATQTMGLAPEVLSASASSGLAVNFTSSTPAVCTVAGSILTLVSTGTCTIYANQAGNSSYAQALSVAQTFTVSPASAVLPPCSNPYASGGAVFYYGTFTIAQFDQIGSSTTKNQVDTLLGCIGYIQGTVLGIDSWAWAAIESTASGAMSIVNVMFKDGVFYDKSKSGF